MSLKDIYRTSLALHTDFYQLTMAYGYWKEGLKDKEAVYHLHFRKNPFQGGFAIACGLEAAIDFIRDFKFDLSDLQYLSTLLDVRGERTFPDEFLQYLGNLRFSVDVDAMPEGTAVFPQEPLLRVSGPIIECQLLESPLLNLINFSTLVATKGARVALAAKGDPVLEFGMRRAQGIDGALTASRAAYIGGCHATSNVLAGKLFDIPVKGTHAHSWIMAFEEEVDSFYAFADALPGNTVFLVDTYNTLDGVKKAIEVGNALKEKGRPFLGIRLDSGDLAYLSIEARRMLDEAGFPDAEIYASNELDETVIQELKQQGARIAVWGVGTKLATAKDQPALDGIYKLSAVRDPGGEWDFKLKLSEQMIKISNPGILDVKRFYHQGRFIADAIYDKSLLSGQTWNLVDPLDPTREKTLEPHVENVDLLQPIFRRGKLVYESPTIQELRARTLSQLEQLHPGTRRFLNPHLYVVGMEANLYAKKVALIKAIRGKFLTPKRES